MINSLQALSLLLFFGLVGSVEIRFVDYQGLNEMALCSDGQRVVNVTRLSHCGLNLDNLYVYLFGEYIYAFDQLESQCRLIPNSFECLNVDLCNDAVSILNVELEELTQYSILPYQVDIHKTLPLSSMVYAPNITEFSLAYTIGTYTTEPSEASICVYCNAFTCQLSDSPHAVQYCYNYPLVIYTNNPGNCTGGSQPVYASMSLSFLAQELLLDQLRGRVRRQDGSLSCWSDFIGEGAGCGQQTVGSAFNYWFQNSDVTMMLSTDLKSLQQQVNNQGTMIAAQTNAAIEDLRSNVQKSLNKGLNTLSQSLSRSVDEEIMGVTAELNRRDNTLVTKVNDLTIQLDATAEAVSKIRELAEVSWDTLIRTTKTIDNALNALAGENSAAQHQLLELLKFVVTSNIRTTLTAHALSRITREQVLDVARTPFGMIVISGANTCNYYFCGNITPSAIDALFGQFTGTYTLQCDTNPPHLVQDPLISWSSNCHLKEIGTNSWAQTNCSTPVTVLRSNPAQLIALSNLNHNGVINRLPTINHTALRNFSEQTIAFNNMQPHIHVIVADNQKKIKAINGSLVYDPDTLHVASTVFDSGNTAVDCCLAAEIGMIIALVACCCSCGPWICVIIACSGICYFYAPAYIRGSANKDAGTENPYDSIRSKLQSKKRKGTGRKIHFSENTGADVEMYEIPNKNYRPPSALSNTSDKSNRSYNWLDTIAGFNDPNTGLLQTVNYERVLPEAEVYAWFEKQKAIKNLKAGPGVISGWFVAWAWANEEKIDIVMNGTNRFWAVGLVAGVTLITNSNSLALKPELSLKIDKSAVKKVLPDITYH